jgi:hypothetical protein
LVGTALVQAVSDRLASGEAGVGDDVKIAVPTYLNEMRVGLIFLERCLILRMSPERRWPPWWGGGEQKNENQEFRQARLTSKCFSRASWWFCSLPMKQRLEGKGPGHKPMRVYTDDISQMR